MARVAIVVDLGFGDAGKGLLTDFLTRRLRAGTVVRFNGGAQAGHNVVGPEGTHHCFSQLGAGMLVPTVRTFLSHEVGVDPLALGVEAAALAGKVGGDPLARLAVDAAARIITPYHRAANRLREQARGEGAHGSCGVGFGETIQDALTYPEDTVRAGELTDRAALRRKLARVRARKREELAPWVAMLRRRGPSTGSGETAPTGQGPQQGPDSRGPQRDTGDRGPRDDFMDREWAVLEDDGLAERWIDAVQAVARRWTIGDVALLGRWLAEAPAVFEGAQGVLLDEQHGFFPHTTWSTCTFAPALALLAAADAHAEPWRVGVVRSHAVRHGAGPLPTETRALDGLVHEHNRTHPFQGRVRYGWFDAVLARYALAAAGGVDALALTHLDLAERAPLFACEDYEAGSAWLTPDPARPLEAQAALTRALFEARPTLRALPSTPRAIVPAIEALIRQRISFVSHGPTAADVHDAEP